jgi:hypothetical protein
MWTERNDHALKSECDDFFNICSKREVLKNKNKNKNKIKFNRSFVFSYLRLLFPPKKIMKVLILTTFLCHGPLPLSYQSTIFASPIAKFVGARQRMMSALKYVF